MKRLAVGAFFAIAGMFLYQQRVINAQSREIKNLDTSVDMLVSMSSQETVARVTLCRDVHQLLELNPSFRLKNGTDATQTFFLPDLLKELSKTCKFE